MLKVLPRLQLSSLYHCSHVFWTRSPQWIIPVTLMPENGNPCSHQQYIPDRRVTSADGKAYPFYVDNYLPPFQGMTFTECIPKI